MKELTKKKHGLLDDLAGLKLDRLMVVERVEGRPGHTAWKCLCDCGNYCIYTQQTLRLDLKPKRKQCHQCQEKLRPRRGDHRGWSGVGDMGGSYWSTVLLGARERKLAVEITKEDAYDQYLAQGGMCALSGMPIVFCTRYRDGLQTASLDRIDSSKGYIAGNIQWIHKDINSMKWDLSEDLFIEYCTKISKYKNG